MSINKINCPNCKTEIEIDKILDHQISEKYKIEFENKLQTLQTELNGKAAFLEEQTKEFEAKKARENEIFQNKLRQEKERIIEEETKKVNQRFQEEYEIKHKAFQQELNQKKDELNKLKDKELEFLKKHELVLEKEREIELTIQRKLNEEREQVHNKIEDRIKEKYELELKEMQLKMEQTQKALAEAQQKSIQSSMQLQGEVFEVVLEEMLQHSFPFDKVEEVKKGMKGADCILNVRNQFGNICGSIIFEAKNTKEFNQEWIEKLKKDQIQSGSEFAVLVSKIFPKDIEYFQEINGVWLCRFDEVKALVSVLRNGILTISQIKDSQVNKGTKMGMLYDYITSHEFKMQVTAIKDTYEKMKFELDREKKAMERIWKSREKQIEIFSLNTSLIQGSIEGLTGNTIDGIRALELNEGIEDLDIEE